MSRNTSSVLMLQKAEVIADRPLGANADLTITYPVYKQVSTWRENMPEYLSADIICSEKRTVFRRERNWELRGTEMSKDKYLSIFSRQMETIVFIILHIFYATRTVLKIGGYSRILPVLAGG